MISIAVYYFSGSNIINGLYKDCSGLGERYYYRTLKETMSETYVFSSEKYKRFRSIVDIYIIDIINAIPYLNNIKSDTL